MFEDMKMPDDESCDVFFEKIIRLASDAGKLGEQIPNKLIVDNIFLCMNSKFKHIIATLEKSEMGMTRDHEKLMATLNNYEKDHLIQQTSQNLDVSYAFEGLSVREKRSSSGTSILTVRAPEVTPLKTYKAKVEDSSYNESQLTELLSSNDLEKKLNFLVKQELRRRNLGKLGQEMSTVSKPSATKSHPRSKFRRSRRSV